MPEPSYKKTFINKDLSNWNFKGKDFSNSLFYACDGRHTDFRESDITGCSFAKSDMSHSKFIGAKITLNCHTFKEMGLDKATTCMFLYLLSLAAIPDELKNGIISLIGEVTYKKLKEYFESVGA